MLEAILSTLGIMLWLGITFIILVSVNICVSTVQNVWAGDQDFSWKKMFKGISKALIFYMSAVFISVAFTMLPYINAMITSSFGTVLISHEVLEILSSVGVLGVVCSAVVMQGKKALECLVSFNSLSLTPEEIITWEVSEDDEEEAE